ncbi:hypothetical protein [Delftia acidovorans]|uniref:hypothetical protein n=1 Tax=Delftia acidovorans TaxID=80866 RepID=UPI0011418A28|nr:hypothetical protein [Delftia acidovorans]
MTVAQGERVISPLDWEEYRRIAATGGGSIDPADDTTNYVSVTYRRYTGALNDPAPLATSSGDLSVIASGATVVKMPVVSAGTRTMAFSLLGRGSLGALLWLRGNPTAMRTEVIVDGRTVFNQSQNFSSANMAGILVGGGIPNPSDSRIIGITPDSSDLQFRRSLTVYVTPAATTIANAMQVAYRGRADA